MHLTCLVVFLFLFYLPCNLVLYSIQCIGTLDLPAADKAHMIMIIMIRRLSPARVHRSGTVENPVSAAYQQKINRKTSKLPLISANPPSSATCHTPALSDTRTLPGGANLPRYCPKCPIQVSPRRNLGSPTFVFPFPPASIPLSLAPCRGVERQGQNKERILNLSESSSRG